MRKIKSLLKVPMYKYIKKIKSLLKILMYKYIEDFLIFCGLLIIISATFILNIIVGMYALGVVLILLGIYFARYPPGGGEK